MNTQASFSIGTPTRRQILQAIADCDRFINKESPRAADLRPASVAALLEKYVAHKAKLQQMLDAA